MYILLSDGMLFAGCDARFFLILINKMVKITNKMNTKEHKGTTI